MPLYEYECDACGHRFEIIRKFSDPPVEKCPVCGGGVHKLQSAPAFHLKGSGWYITDYPKKDSTGEAKSDGKTDKSGAGDKPTAETKTEKADTKTPADTKSSKDSKDSKDSKRPADKST